MNNSIKLYSNETTKTFHISVDGQQFQNCQLEPHVLKVLFGQDPNDFSPEIVIDKKIENIALYRMIKSHFWSIDCNASLIAALDPKYNGVGKSKKSQFKEKAHGFGEMVQIVYEIINSNIEKPTEGDVFEFGCFTGIGSAKLSLAASFLNKKFYGFDSFQGLPDINEYGTGNQKEIYAANDYSGSKALVETNVKIHGCSKNLGLIEGYFSETLEPFFKNKKDQKIAACFIDADISKSIDECLEYVIPRLSVGSLLIMHEVNDSDNFDVFHKHDLFNTDTYEMYTVGSHGQTTDFKSKKDMENMHGCGILRKIK
jgi:hypothetical protein